MSASNAVGSIVCLLGAMGLAFVSAQGYAGNWSSPDVIDQRDGDYFASVAIDKDDDLHAAYLFTPDFEAPEIVYASNASGDWERRTIAELPAFSGSRPDIAVSGGREPFIVYSTLPAEPPKLAFFQGWLWQIADCPSEVMSHGAPLVFVDDDDNVHIVFCYADGSIQYLCKMGLFWESDILDAAADEVTGIAVDSSFVPHVLYLDREGNLICAAPQNGAWEYELVASPAYGLIGLWDSFVVDDEDNLRLAYLDGTPPLTSKLFCAEKTGESWETEALEDGGIWAQIAVGASYTTQIAHIQSYSQNDKTRYLFGDDLGWHSENVPLKRYGQWSLASRMIAMTADAEYLHIVYAGEDETADGGNALLCIRGEQGQAIVGVSAELLLNDDSFKMHDTISVSAHVTNGPEEAAVEAKVWVEDPSGEVFSVLDPFSTFAISPGTDEEFLIHKYTFTGREAPGNYKISARLIDPVTGEELSIDSEQFHFSAF
ncbi:MAG: hypothetical protein JW759_05255 [Candidatus Coatesbacteria bacterium]|nr:hypothetical protein [Candidatus Coatesbacteria bacterium]